MSTFVLIHGGAHGAWCRYKLIPRLTAAGHRVVAPDLPGCGIDTTRHSDVTLQACVERVCGLIDAAEEPVVLIGHSAGGGVITQAAEERHTRIRTLVYLAALPPLNGETPYEAFVHGADARFEEALARSRAEEQASTTVPRDIAHDRFFADCCDEDVALALTLLRPAPVGPMRTPVLTTPQRFGSVPRTYAQTLKDRALLPEQQARLFARQPCRRVSTLDSSHSPFFSAPDALASLLTDIAADSSLATRAT